MKDQVEPRSDGDVADLVAKNLDPNYYLAQVQDGPVDDPVSHFIETGAAQGLDPSAAFCSRYYRASNPDLAQLGGLELFLHFIRHGKSEGRLGAIPTEVARAFDADHYLASFDEADARPDDPLMHYLTQGWKEGRDPSPQFSSAAYLAINRDLDTGAVEPFTHWIRHGKAEGRRSERSIQSTASAQTRAARVTPELVAAFDEDFYRSQLSPDVPVYNAIGHFAAFGWRQGLDPSPDFSVSAYLERNPGVDLRGSDAYSHFLKFGEAEGLQASPSRFRLPDVATSVFDAQTAAVRPGPHFEEARPDILAGRRPTARIIANYLPQFHAFEENDRFWGKGFTEWTNIARGMPRFGGHVQPRIPRDLGFYDLSDPGVIRRQAEMAKASGIGAFAFYYYWFDGETPMRGPLDAFCGDDSIPLDFCLIWANENWTRTWDGFDDDVLLGQSYATGDDARLVADWARYLAHPRYMRLGGRELFVIYRPGEIPQARQRIAEWRERLRRDHDLSPLMFMVQGFDTLDPAEFGLDGAMEFPPHKLGTDLPDVAPSLHMFDADHSGQIRSWDHLVAASSGDPDPDFPLIRAACPSWDNEARRPGRALTFHGSTPDKFEDWMRDLLGRARANPVCGEAVVGINAWNEWAEGAYLEPDVHHGSAYLNALARAVVASERPAAANRLVVAGHDAQLGGAQILMLNLCRQLGRVHGYELIALLGDGGPLLAQFEATCETLVMGSAETERRLGRLIRDGFDAAIVNSAASGSIAAALGDAGLRIVSLVHEFPATLERYGLTEEAGLTLRNSDIVVYPAETVRDAFEAVYGRAETSQIRPQGLFDTSIEAQTQQSKARAREALGLPQEATVAIAVGYGDWRKGPDRFFALADDLCRKDASTIFVWVGPLHPDVTEWARRDVDDLIGAGRLRIVDYTDALSDWYTAADLLVLPSREDPFPSVVLEALAAGLPIVCWQGATGCEALVARHGHVIREAGRDPAARTVRHALQAAAQEDGTAAESRRRTIAEDHDFAGYTRAMAALAKPDVAGVSVIVPLYDYEDYVEERLGGILNQSYPIAGLTVLDDCSPDESVGRAEICLAAHGRSATIVRNEANSGSPFRQWLTGLKTATSTYVWIAEADDTSSPAFLASMIAEIERHGAEIAFCDSRQIGPEGQLLAPGYAEYLRQCLGRTFTDPFVMDAGAFGRDCLTVLNPILNVSGAIFRTETMRAAMERCAVELDDFRVAGDWRLYIEICKMGGRVCYLPEALNMHRRHARSVTGSLAAERHFAEISGLQTLAAEAFGASDDVAARQEAYLRRTRTDLFGEVSGEQGGAT